MTTPTQPADLLAQLDFEPDEHHAVADMANVGYSLMQAVARHCPGYVYSDSPAEIVGDLMGDLDDLRKKISDLTGAAHGYKQELEAERAALADHRGEAAGEVVRSSPEVMIGRIYDQARVRTGDKLYTAPPQVQAEDVAVLTETTIGKAFLSVLADPSHQWRLTGAKTFIDMVAALATEEPNDGWHPLSNPLPNSPIIEQAQAGAGDADPVWLVAKALWNSQKNSILRPGQDSTAAWEKRKGSYYIDAQCVLAALEARREPE